MARATLADVARVVGVSRATVSYALHNHRKIPATTRERIRAAADTLGYRPDTTLAAQMAHLRRGERIHEPETLAFVWIEQTRDEISQNEYHRILPDAARRRAETLGYRFDEFYLRDEGLTARRLGVILKTRGIRGVIFGPVMKRSYAHLRLNWTDFSSVCIGLALTQPPLHRVAHSHYEGMRFCLHALHHRGFRRPALVLNALAHERSRRAWVAAFLAYHPQAAEAARLVRLTHGEGDGHGAATWLRQVRADVAIVEASVLAVGFRIPGVSLNWHPAHPECPGVDQRYETLAATAVNILTGQLAHNETGLPALPISVSVSPAWRDAARM